jgi:hypothetical protein
MTESLIATYMLVMGNGLFWEGEEMRAVIQLGCRCDDRKSTHRKLLE